jgi:hypothetical protein
MRCRSALSERILFEDERRFWVILRLVGEGCGTTADVRQTAFVER